MRIVRFSHGRVYEVPDTFVEGQEMIEMAMRYHNGRGRNLALQATLARVAFGLYGEKFMAADPLDALAYLVQQVCIQGGINDPAETSED